MALFLVDNRGQPTTRQLSQQPLVNVLFGEICVLIEAADIQLADLFLNEDKVFNSRKFRQESARQSTKADILCNRRAVD